MAKAITIDDIAALAGVSRSTVSRVLTDNKNVKKETAVKVRKAMEALEYRPNILARGLATGAVNIVSMLMSDPDQPFYLQLMDRMDRELRERGFILNLFYLGRDDHARCETFRIVQEYGFAGLIMGDIRNEPELIAEVKRSRRPLVFFNRYIETLSEFDAVITDNYFGGYLAGKHLLELGHRRMSMLTGPLKSSASRDRYRGFYDAMAESGLELPNSQVVEGDLTLECGLEFAAKFFTRKQKSTAVFLGNDLMAIGFLTYCRDKGIDVPARVSVIGFDDVQYAGSSLVNLTTIRQPYEQMSTLAVERIVARIQGDDLPRQCIMLEPKLIVRGTTSAI